MDEQSVTAKIEILLQGLAAEAPVRQVMVIDDSGTILSQVGGEDVNGGQVALGALLAGMFLSARTLAEMYGEAELRVLFLQGRHTNIYTARIDERWLLVIIFERQAHEGLVRLRAAQLVEVLAAVVVPLAGTDMATREIIHDAAFHDSVVNAIDDLFRDG